MAQQRLRARMIKGADIRFLSHLEYMGTIEKGVRRARIPVAFSRGFHPQPQIAPASALPVGHSSEGEYTDFTLVQEMDPDEFCRRLNHKLPAPMALPAVREIGLDTPSLMSQVNLAAYRVELEASPGEELPTGEWARFKDQPRILVNKRSKKGWRKVDARPLLVSGEFKEQDGDLWSMELKLAAGAQGSLRPEELLGAFFEFQGRQGEIKKVHRLGLFVLQGHRVHTPLDPAVAPGPGRGKGADRGE